MFIWLGALVTAALTAFSCTPQEIAGTLELGGIGESVQFKSSADTAVVAVNANTDWRIEYDTDLPWVATDIMGGPSTIKEFKIIVKENIDPILRFAKIRVFTIDKAAEYEITALQIPANPAIVMPATHGVNPDAQDFSLAVTANVSEAEIGVSVDYQGAQDWVESVSVEDGLIYVSVGRNFSSADRTAVIKLDYTDEYGRSASATLTLTQEGVDPENIDLDAYYVRPVATGDKTGLDWDNAMGIEGLRKLLGPTHVKRAKDSKVYMSEGSYLLPESKEGFVIGYPAETEAVKIEFFGGYSASSTGKDLTQRNAETIITGDANADGQTGEGDYALITVSENVDLSFDGIIFERGYCAGTQQEKYFPGFTINKASTLSMTGCTMRNFYNAMKNGSGKKYEGGAAIYIQDAATVKLNGVKFLDNTSMDRGGVIRNAGKSRMFINGCLFEGNKLISNTTSGGQYGTAIWNHTTGSCLLINNSTFTNEAVSGRHGIISITSSAMIVNSTFVEPFNTGASLNSGITNANEKGLVLNSIISNNTGSTKMALKINASDKLVSGGYNIINGAVTTNSASAGVVTGWLTSTDATGVTASNPVLTWDATKGVHTWDGTLAGFNMATSTALLDKVKAFAPASYPTAGTDFAAWLEEIGAWDKDQLGNNRGTSFWPGAYQGN